VVSNQQHHESADREAVMSGKWGRMFAGVMIALPLGACITMQKKEDGKTHISIPNPLAGLLKGEEGDSRGGTSTGTAVQDGRQAAQTAAGGSSTRQTSANGNDSGEVALFDPRWTDAPMISDILLAAIRSVPVAETACECRHLRKETLLKDGYNAARAGDYDLIILDVMMPIMNGFEVAKKKNGAQFVVKTHGYDVVVKGTHPRNTGDILCRTFNRVAPERVEIVRQTLRIKGSIGIKSTQIALACRLRVEPWLQPCCI